MPKRPLTIALGMMTSLDSPGPLVVLTSHRQHPPITVTASGKPTAVKDPLPFVDDLNGGGSLVWIHADHHASHAVLLTSSRDVMARRATLLRAGQTPLEPLLAAVLGARGMPCESHTQPHGGQPMRERPAEHLDRAWPGTDRATGKQVAMSGRPAQRCGLTQPQQFETDVGRQRYRDRPEIGAESPFRVARSRRSAAARSDQSWCSCSNRRPRKHVK